jgi:hypothetical protein
MITDCFVTHGLLTEHRFCGLYIYLAEAAHSEHIYTEGGGVGSSSFDFTTSNPACNPTLVAYSYLPTIAHTSNISHCHFMCWFTYTIVVQVTKAARECDAVKRATYVLNIAQFLHHELVFVDELSFDH